MRDVSRSCETPRASDCSTSSPSSEETQILLSSATAEFHPSSSGTTWPDRSCTCASSSQTRKSSRTSEAASTSNAKDCVPYWDDFCREQSSRWWLPAGTDSLGSGLISSNFSSVKTVEKSWFSTELRIAPIRNSPETCFRFCTSSPAACTAYVATASKSRRIRVYPSAEQRAIFRQWHGTARWFYNKTVEYLSQPETKANWYAIKGVIMAQSPDWARDVPYQIKSVAIRDACQAVTAAKIKCKRTGQFQKVKFRSRKEPVQSCFVPKSAVSVNGLYHTVSGQLFWSEPIPRAVRDSRLVYRSGRWYVSVPFTSPRQLAENQGRVVSLDPGIRSFLTFYSDSECGKIACGDFGRVIRLCRHLDKLVSLSATSRCRKRRRLRKAADRMRWKIRDLVDELHHKAALFLVRNYDVILLPTYNSSEMVRRATRRIRSKSVRSMLSWAPHRFATFLKHKAFEYGKTVVDVNEAYTSKTVSWTGEIVQNLGGRKTIRSKIDCRMMDRDYNGARGIMLRALRDHSLCQKAFVATAFGSEN